MDDQFDHDEDLAGEVARLRATVDDAARRAAEAGAVPVGYGAADTTSIDDSPARPTPGPPRHARAAGRLRAAPAALGRAFDLRQTHGRLLSAAAALAVITIVLVALLYDSGGRSRVTPVSPPRPVAQGPGTSAKSPATSAPPDKPFNCPKSAKSDGSTAPDRICLPDLHVEASVVKLGLNRDRTVEVPPLSRVGDAGWYKYSAAPGAVGPTVILGHVDSAQYGQGVFYKLSKLHAGDPVMLTRGDGKIATYRIDKVDEVSKREFPTRGVYGPTSRPAIRLVTCGGNFNSATGSYEDNIIAYGTLQSLRPS